MQTTEGKGVRPLYKFTSLFKNIISKNYTDGIKVDRTRHAFIPQNEYIFLSLIIQIHILNQNHTQALASSSLLLWLLLPGVAVDPAAVDPAASYTLAATSASCFQASLLSSHAKHHSQEGKKRLAHVPACICVFSHTRATTLYIYRQKHLISYAVPKSGQQVHWCELFLPYCTSSELIIALFFFWSF